jgi:hypothetical protein
VEKWIELLEGTRTDRRESDQMRLNAVLRANSSYCRDGWVGPPLRNPDTSFCGRDPLLNVAANATACFGLLNLAQFANGMTFSLARLHEQLGVAPYALHATYSGDKVSRLREEGLLLEDPPPQPVKYLRYTNQLPSSLLHTPLDQEAPPGFYTLANHYALMQLQLRQMHAAFALAAAEGRTLLLPALVSICQCFYFPGVQCSVAGHLVRLPHVMPQDHWLKPGYFEKAGLLFREPGFETRPEDDVRRVDDSLAALAAEGDDARGRAEALRPAFELALGSWCCTRELPNGTKRVWPQTAWKVRYTLSAPLEYVDGGSPEIGRCGA